MNFRYAVLTAIILVSRIYATSINHPKFGSQTVTVPLARSLRVNALWSDEAEEERGAISTATEKFKSLFTASEVSSNTLARWKKEKKSPADALARLKLSNAGSNLFQKPQFKTWLEYMSTIGKHTSLSILLALKKHYSDEAISKMIIAAKQDPSTKRLATNLQDEQIRVWLNQEKPAGDIFTLLQLNKVDDNLLNNAEFAVWINYLDDLKLPTKDWTIWSTISAHYTDDALAPMLIAAKNNPETKTMATKLQAEQVASWLSKDKSADDVFTLLQLNKATGNQLDVREFMLWSKYLDDLKIPNKETTMLSTMSAHYGDDVVSEMLIAAKKTTSTASIARKLQTEQIRLWLKQKKSADDVFTMLQLNKADDALFDIPEFTLWSKYLDDLDVKFPRKEMTMVSTLATHYSDEAMINLINSAKHTPGMKSLATRLEAEQMHKWLKVETSPVDVFKLYQLDKAGNGLLTSPQLDTWITYMNKFNIEFKSKKTTMLGTFTQVYGDNVVAQIIIAAKGVEKTKELATAFQKTQIKRWLKKRTPVSDVFKWLGVKGTKSNHPERLVWEKYRAAFLGIDNTA